MRRCKVEMLTSDEVHAAKLLVQRQGMSRAMYLFELSQATIYRVLADVGPVDQRTAQRVRDGLKRAARAA